jgi:hypothetical protein
MGKMKKLIAGIAGLALAAGLSGITAIPSIAASNGTDVVSPGFTASGQNSLNWAGYVKTDGGAYAVSANWTVPSVAGPNGYSASWVGLDGDGSPTVEQTGTMSAVIAGQPAYLAWVELYPASSVLIQDPVYPGDRMSGSVRAIGHGYYAIRLTDNTRGWNYARTVLDPAGMNASAEVITEAPSSAATRNILPLANFGSEHFTDVNISGYATRVGMVARNWRVKASVSGSQRDFTVHFEFAGLQH